MTDDNDNGKTKTRKPRRKRDDEADVIASMCAHFELLPEGAARSRVFAYIAQRFACDQIITVPYGAHVEVVGPHKRQGQITDGDFERIERTARELRRETPRVFDEGGQQVPLGDPATRPADV